MTMDNLADTLRMHPFVQGFEAEHIEKLAGLAGVVRFDKNAIIFRDGDTSSFLYLLLSGSVVLEVPTAGRILRVQTIGKGQQLGWSSMLPELSKQFQARVLEPVTALVFDGARLRRECDADPGFGYIMMRRTLRVVSERLQATRMQLLDIYAPTKSATGA